MKKICEATTIKTVVFLSANVLESLAFEDAMANEIKHGLPAMQREAVAGATRFAKGSGRHGRFETPED